MFSDKQSQRIPVLLHGLLGHISGFMGLSLLLCAENTTAVLHGVLLCCCLSASKEHLCHAHCALSSPHRMWEALGLAEVASIKLENIPD